MNIPTIWPYSGTFSAANALLESTENKKYQKTFGKQSTTRIRRVFRHTKGEPFAYSSYISSQPLSDRFFMMITSG